LKKEEKDEEEKEESAASDVHKEARIGLNQSRLHW